jgi:hypothetical protein
MGEAGVPERDRCVQRLAEMCGIPVRIRMRYDWMAVEGSLGGLSLPADYKDLVAIFPDGWFRDLVRPIRPGDVGAADTEYLGFYANWLEDMRTWRSNGDGQFPYPIYPETGGLLPWAEGPGGEMCFWLTGPDDPGVWPVVSADKDFMRWQLFQGSMCEFLTALVRGSVDNPFEPGSAVPVTTAAFSGFEDETAPSGGAMVDAAFATVAPLTAAAAIPPATAAPAWGARPPRNEYPELSTVLPADVPTPPGTDWRALEGRLGVALPVDYKSFVDRLGAGRFCDIRILGLDPCGEYDLPTVLERRSRSASASQWSSAVPFYPRPSGVIPWGETADGWLCAWRFIDREPEQWPVLMIAPDYNLVFLDELSFSSFLLEYCGHRDQTGVFFARPRWDGGATFVPHAHRVNDGRGEPADR